MITAGTLHKAHHFQGEQRLDLLQNSLLDVFQNAEWILHAWAVFSNHYHCIAEAPGKPNSLRSTVQRFHSQSARSLNRLDGKDGRRVWFQYWDSCLTFEQSYYARMKYVLTNPVRHGIVECAEDYPWCSARAFAAESDASFRKRVQSYACDRVKVPDDF